LGALPSCIPNSPVFHPTLSRTFLAQPCPPVIHCWYNSVSRLGLTGRGGFPDIAFCTVPDLHLEPQGYVVINSVVLSAYNFGALK
jgi:hypothetical protein